MNRRFLPLFLLLTVATTLQAQSYTDYIDSSFTYLDEGNLLKAEETLLAALRLEPANPGNVLLLSNLGTIQRRMGKLSEALDSYNNALTRAPQSLTLLNNRAALWAEMDSLQRAQEDFSQILLLDGKNEEALYRRGLIFLEMNDTTAARNDFDRLLSLNPQSADARIGMAALMKNRARYDQAIILYTQVIRANPHLASLYLNRAEAYYYNRQYNRASDDIEMARQLTPDDPLVYIMRGKVKLARFEKVEAKEDFDKAVSLGFDAEEISQMTDQ
ncbi:MAG: tetratricopeptide repeat protein [Porphyromonadaceae bacterium]|nr:tetratricopeptide repeat protein [Porphyromonadaceae bacterium]